MTESFPTTFGRYQLLEDLAVGGMAELFLARAADGADGEALMVIKRLLPHLARQPGYTEMFLDEARLTARMTHPNIPQIYEFGRCDGYLFIAMEFVDGIDALAMLCECAHAKRRLSPELGVHVAREILDALDFAHNQVDEHGNPLGVIHRDISPSNVLLSLGGEVKLADFGIAWAVRRSHHTKTGVLKGKYGYLSPEQILFDDVDARSDLFSVGVLLAELLTGRRLFSAPRELDVLLMVRDVKLDRLDAVCDRLHPELERILRKALRKQPDERFPSAAEFRDALDEWVRKHGGQVDISKVARVVHSLYQRVWERKRGGVPGLLAGTHREGPPEAAAVPAEPASGDLAQGGDQPGGILVMDEVENRETSSTQSEWAEISEPSAMAPAGEVPPADHGRPGELRAGADLGERAPDASMAEEDGVVGAACAPASAAGADPGEAAGAGHAARRASGHAAGARRAAPAASDTAGEFARTSPIGVLYQLATAGASGLLTVSVGAIYKEIFLRRGAPRYVSSNVFSERFGEYLVQEGVIFPGELSMALAMMPRYQNRLSETLVSLNLISPLDVLRHLTLQVRKKIVDVCTWTKGHYAWYEGRASPREAFPLDLNMFEVLGAGTLALSGDTIETWLRDSAQARPRLESAGRTAPQTFQLGAPMRDVCRALDGTRTVAELRARFAVRNDYEHLVRMLYLLVQTGLATAASG